MVAQILDLTTLESNRQYNTGSDRYTKGSAPPPSNRMEESDDRRQSAPAELVPPKLKIAPEDKLKGLGSSASVEVFCR